MVLVVAALAVARVTRLITTDYLTDPPRSWLVRRLGQNSKLAYLLVCQWCMSMWVASVAALLLWAVGPVPGLVWPMTALAMSQAAGMLSRGDD